MYLQKISLLVAVAATLSLTTVSGQEERHQEPCHHSLLDWILGTSKHPHHYDDEDDTNHRRTRKGQHGQYGHQRGGGLFSPPIPIPMPFHGSPQRPHSPPRSSKLRGSARIRGDVPPPPTQILSTSAGDTFSMESFGELLLNHHDSHKHVSSSSDSDNDSRSQDDGPTPSGIMERIGDFFFHHPNGHHYHDHPHGPGHQHSHSGNKGHHHPHHKHGKHGSGRGGHHDHHHDHHDRSHHHPHHHKQHHGRDSSRSSRKRPHHPHHHSSSASSSRSEADTMVDQKDNKNNEKGVGGSASNTASGIGEEEDNKHELQPPTVKMIVPIVEDMIDVQEDRD